MYAPPPLHPTLVPGLAEQLAKHPDLASLAANETMDGPEVHVAAEPAPATLPAAHPVAP